MESQDSSHSMVPNEDVFDQQDSNSIPDQIAFDQQVSNSFPEFKGERKRCCQDLVSNLETLDNITFI